MCFLRGVELVSYSLGIFGHDALVVESTRGEEAQLETPDASFKRSSTVFPRVLSAITVFTSGYARIRAAERFKDVVDVVIKSSARPNYPRVCPDRG